MISPLQAKIRHNGNSGGRQQKTARSLRLSGESFLR